MPVFESLYCDSSTFFDLHISYVFVFVYPVVIEFNNDDRNYMGYKPRNNSSGPSQKNNVILCFKWTMDDRF